MAKKITKYAAFFIAIALLGGCATVRANKNPKPPDHETQVRDLEEEIRRKDEEIRQLEEEIQRAVSIQPSLSADFDYRQKEIS